MKFLEVPEIEQQINAFLNGIDSLSGDCKIFGRVEPYTCKRAGSDKKLYKSLEQQYQVELSKSPIDSSSDLATSPFGPLSESSSRKSLISLISVLNASFPDYDFCYVRAEQFKKESSPYMVINSINTVLAGVIPNYNNDLAPKLWNILDNEIRVRECDIYSYIPDMDSDPYAETGCIWSFNYFWYNKKLKRIIFFTCRAVSKVSLDDSEPIMSDNEEEGRWTYEDDVGRSMELDAY